jgi:hypothetical protein
MAKSTLVMVNMSAPYADIKYAFKTVADASVRTALGHVPVIATTPVQGLILHYS